MHRVIHICILATVFVLHPNLRGEAWNRHVVDASSRGADGVRLADVDRDGFLDIATGWEEGGVTRVYLNPGPFRAKSEWPSVTAGRNASPEDAVLVDLDGDGATDVVSSCEGEERAIYLYRAPTRESYMDPEEWRTIPLASSVGRMQWMWVAPLEVDFRRGVDLVAGGKGPGAEIGWFEAPADPWDAEAWRWHPIRPAGWVMSLITNDMDGDGDLDILASDRRKERSGAFWLENPGPGSSLDAKWPEHAIGATGREVMFLSAGDLDGDGLEDVVAAVRPDSVYIFRRLGASGEDWEEIRVALPEGVGTAKAVGIGDIDGDGQHDLVFSCEGAEGTLSGVGWFSYKGSIKAEWSGHEISGPVGVKFDLVELIDLDGDGDLDVLTCEERAGLGVIWYENPAE